MIISYIGDYTFDGNEFCRVTELKHSILHVYNIKQFFKVNNLEVSLECPFTNIIDLQLFNTEFKKNINENLDTVFKVQFQNFKKDVKYIPYTTIKRLLKEQYKILCDSFVINENFNNTAVKIHNILNFSLLQTEKQTKLNFNVFGTYTGRITHELSQLNLQARYNKFLYKFENVHEFDFVNFEIANGFSYKNIKVLNDLYIYKDVDRKIVKNVVISMLYGMSIPNIKEKYKDIQNIDNVLQYIESKFKELIELRETIIDKSIKDKKLEIPIQCITVDYKEQTESDIRRKCFNNFLQGISAGILKLKIINLYLNKIDILFPVYDSIFISTNKPFEVKNVLEQSILYIDTSLKKRTYYNTVRINKIKKEN